MLREDAEDNNLTRVGKRLITVLAAVLILFGCQSQEQGEIEVEYLGINGRKLNETLQSSESLSRAPAVRVFGKQFETSYGQQLRVHQLLQGLAVQNDTAPLRLKLPISEKFGEVRDWDAVDVNGTIFIVGGRVSDDLTPLKLTWLYDPDRNELNPGPMMSWERSSPCLTLLRDKRVLITGGEDKRGPIALSEVCDIAKKELVKFGQLRVPRVGHSVLEMENGTILVVSGRSTARSRLDTEPLTSTFETLSLGSNQYKLAGKIDIAREYSSLVPINNHQALVVGGWHSNITGDNRWVRIPELVSLPDRGCWKPSEGTPMATEPHSTITGAIR